MRITLLTGAIILLTSLLLTFASMYNARDNLVSMINIIPDSRQEVPYQASYTLSPFATSESVAMSTVALEAKREFDYWSYISLAIVAVLGMGASYFFAGRALNPVRQLGDAVADINEHNLTARLSTVETKDEIGTLMNSFNGMLDRLEDSFARQKRFSSNVAHELRTPLATLKMGMQMAQMDGNHYDEETQEIFSITERNVDRLIAIVNDLLMLTNETIEDIEQKVCVSYTMKNIIDELTPCYQEKKLRIEYNFHDETYCITGNQCLIGRVFYNLVGNAMKYNVAQGTLRIITDTTSNGVDIIVADSGMGISEQDLQKIFDPFYCADPSRSRKLGGAGLGLSIVKTIVERHGWQIHAQSTKGIGTAFTITIPNTRI